MSEMLRVRTILAGCVTALALTACGGGGGGGDSAPVGNTPPPAQPIPDPLTPAPPLPDNPVIPGAPGAPLATGNIALDGREWLNYRRSLVGLSTLARNAVIDSAAQGHSDYQAIHGITHDQVAGKQGFTGASLEDRLRNAGYVLNRSRGYAFGEVISATSNGNGQYMAEELITAIYHRFVIFEPVFKEIGTGAASNSRGYSYFTANFAINDGSPQGLAKGQIVSWPFNGMTAVPIDFFSDTERPDPIPSCKENPAPGCDLNRVGYPISVHTNIDSTVTVGSFTVRPRGGANLAVRLLTSANDTHTKEAGAAIIPLAPLAANTVYEVSFTGTAGGQPVTRDWAFTTR